MQPWPRLTADPGLARKMLTFTALQWTMLTSEGWPVVPGLRPTLEHPCPGA